MVLFLLIFGPLIFTSLVTMLLGNFFVKAGIDPKKARIPFLNVFLWFKILERTPAWLILMFVPYINLILIIWMTTEFLKCFGRADLTAQVLGIFFGYIYLPYLNTKPNDIRYGGRYSVAKSGAREWVDALIFAIVAATIIRTFIVEAYTIPTSSMEKTLLVGDYLFVSKFHYGPRVPNTPLSIPFVHHTLPLFNIKSYTELVSLPYYRFPGLENVNRNDMVVFNWPDDVGRPVDKKENYIKRCVAIAGDKLEIRDGDLFINDKPAFAPKDMQYSYLVVKNDGQPLDSMTLVKLKITDADILTVDDMRKYNLMLPAQIDSLPFKYVFRYMLTQEKVDALRKNPNVLAVVSLRKDKSLVDPSVFPQNATHFPWNADNFGPLVVPKKGMTIPLNVKNYLLYKRIITEYEGNTLSISPNDKAYVNEKEVTEYTFKMDYYWMMGDNRHNSLDSRFWGFVPEDHIVGKASFIWMSMGNQGDGVRWDRLFTIVHNIDKQE